MATSRTEVEQLVDTNLPTSPPVKIRSVKHREVEKKIIDYATNILSITGVAGTTIVDNRMVGREVGLVVMDDIAKNIGFTKSAGSNTLTFTDGTEVGAGQKITICLL
jgi:hypothetical protein